MKTRDKIRHAVTADIRNKTEHRCYALGEWWEHQGTKILHRGSPLRMPLYGLVEQRVRERTRFMDPHAIWIRRMNA